MRYWAERLEADEWVDDLALPPADIRDTVREQALINSLLGGTRATLVHALPLIRACTGDIVRVLDLACGGGDLTRALVAAVRRRGRAIQVVGLDVNPHVIDCARTASAGYPEISYLQGDARHPPFPPGSFDLVLLATFLHHLPPAEVVALLRTAGDLCRGSVIAADLVRAPAAYWAFRAFAALLRFSPVTQHDGLVSLRRAYTPAELAGLARQAGLTAWTLTRHPIARMTLVYPGAHPEEGCL